jgi:hypothetical protein
MASNVFHHPQFNLKIGEKIEFFNLFKSVFNEKDNTWLKRFELVQELWGINWLCIILNKAIETNSFNEYLERKEYYINLYGK